MHDQANSPGDPEQLETLQAVLNAVPSPLFLLDSQAQVELVNKCARGQKNLLGSYTYQERMGNVMGCINALTCDEGCGGSRNCGDCPIRKAVANTLGGSEVFRKNVVFQLLVDGRYTPVHMWMTSSLMKYGQREFVALIMEDVADLIQQTKLMPVCESCGKVGDGIEHTESLNAYVQERFSSSDEKFLCGDCKAMSN